MDEVQLAALGVALVVRVVEALADLHHHEAGHAAIGIGSPVLRAAIEDRAQVPAVDVLERDEVAVVDLAEVEDLGDVRVVAADTAIFASSMNIVMNSSSSAMFGRMRLTATSRSKPSTPNAFARKTSAMPPTLMRSVSS